ncbi:hypothetical protein [Staphylococcus nepalensis]|uniref:hypothetical protein n=1 Tax=Staphylococcus nepalensis TaxID=214473 RepID=UPI0031BAC8D0
MQHNPLYEYVIYKGEDIVCGGPKQEIIEKMNITESTFYRLISSTTKREAGPNQLIAEKVRISEIEESMDFY